MDAGNGPGSAERKLDRMPKMVKVFGPNMSREDSRHGTFQVHAADCSDCRKLERRYDAWVIAQTETEREVVEAIYPPDDFGYNSDESDDRDPYVTDVWFAPCISLPDGYDVQNPEEGAPARCSHCRGILKTDVERHEGICVHCPPIRRVANGRRIV